MVRIEKERPSLLVGGTGHASLAKHRKRIPHAHTGDFLAHTNPLWQSCGGRPIANRHSARCFVFLTSTIVGQRQLLASSAGDAEVICCIV